MYSASSHALQRSGHVPPSQRGMEWYARFVSRSVTVPVAVSQALRRIAQRHTHRQSAAE